MPNSNEIVQRKAGFFHSLGKVLTESNKSARNEKYKSAHNVLSKEVWMEEPPYSPNIGDAISNNLTSDVVSFIGGGLGTSSILYPLADSNYQTWFLDSGDPTPKTDGFDPSSGWCKPLISPSDVANSAGVPSFGYELVIYRPNDNSVDYNGAFYDVDYFGGLVRFDPGRTPIEPGSTSGLAFQFSKSTFESSGNKLDYIRNLSNNAPRATAFRYIGKTLSDLEFGLTAGNGLTVSGAGDISISLTQSSGLTFSNEGNLIVNTNNTLAVNIGGELSVNGNSVYQSAMSFVTQGDGQATGITISYTPMSFSTVKVFVNGQAILLGSGATISVDCYFSNDSGSSARGYESIVEGDELYFNGAFVGWNLSTDDRIILIYEADLP